MAGARLACPIMRKAGLTMDAARKNCELYKATTGAQQSIQYALASLEREALRNRLASHRAGFEVAGCVDGKDIEDGRGAKCDSPYALLAADNEDQAGRGPGRYPVENHRAIYVPPLSDNPLKDLVAEKQNSEVNEQRALDKLNRQNNWDVALSVGVHQQVNPVAYGAQPYGAVSVNYNFASHAIDNHLDRAV